MSPMPPSWHREREAFILARLREGDTLQAIGDKMDLSRERVRQLAERADPGVMARVKQARAEEEAARRRCPDCGAPVSNPGRRCHPCSGKKRRFWTRERIIEALQREAQRLGDTPPSGAWLYPDTRPEGAPTIRAVQQRFGSWNAAVRAAGLTVYPPGHRRAR